MDNVFKKVQELEKTRNIPQFIFIAGIKHVSTIFVRSAIQKYRKEHPDVKEIDFILESPGGSADHAYILIRTLRENFETVNIIVPFWAKSAATLLALGGSTIIMDEFGEFGPLDVQLSKDDEIPDSEPQSGLIDEYSLNTIEKSGIELYQQMMLNLLKKNVNPTEIDIRIKKTVLSKQIFEYVSSLYRPLFEQIDPYKIGEKARSLAIAERYAERILNQYNKENLKESVESFVDYMVHECPDHGYNIDYSIMSIFLNNVRKASEISEEYCKVLTDLSALFFSDQGEFGYIGFFDKKLLEKESKIKDTDSGSTKEILPPKKEDEADEKKENPKK